MIFKTHSITADGVIIYARIDDDDKCRLTCTEDYPEFKAWLAEGNQPLPADDPQQENN